MVEPIDQPGREAAVQRIGALADRIADLADECCATPAELAEMGTLAYEMYAVARVASWGFTFPATGLAVRAFENTHFLRLFTLPEAFRSTPDPVPQDERFRLRGVRREGLGG